MGIDGPIPSLLALAPLVKFLPYLVAVGVGIYLGISFGRKFSTDSNAADWERKYRDLHARYRNLTQQVNNEGGEAGRQANRLRQTLWDIQGLLRNPESVSPESARAALQEIEAALREAEEPL